MTMYRPDGPGPMRVPPELTSLNREFWTGGFDGELRIRRCNACGKWQQPAAARCRGCLSTDVTARVVSGNATVAAFTINHQHWSPTATTEPYVIAIVELAEDPDVRLTTNIVNCPPTDVRIGMPVSVVFEALADVALPLFEPAR
ncbi:MAG: OB-fold domain-containing protein [Actinomycetota bacterium]|nr:OB-fold domain-containing protein [Actinomycetota bacterium]